MPILVSLDRSFQNPLRFWKSCNLKSLSLHGLHQGKLLEVVESGLATENFFVITKKHLIKLDESERPEMMTSLEWKTISPFQENHKDSTRFGFSIGCKNSVKDFYVENEAELNKWMSHLSKIGIMSDIEDYYQFDKLIGKGANSTVYLARCRATSALYAIKSISKVTTSQSLESIANEIKIMRKLKHPNIVNLHQVYESETHIYMVLDYVEGGNLFEKIIKKKTLPEATVLKFCGEFLKVLKYLNSKNIIHRDIKLENILLTNQDDSLDFKLADFGLATKVSDNLTVRCGSPGYIAPEILRKEKYGRKVDMFGAGVVTYILLTGKMPFFGYFREQVLERNKNCNINFNDDTLSHISKECIELLRKMICPYPELRLSARKALKNIFLSRYIERKKPLNHTSSMFERKIPREDIVFLTKSLEISEVKTIVLQTNFMPMKKTNELRQKPINMV